MFRYILKPCSCQWEIQLLRFGFLWITMHGIRFETLREAVEHADNLGITTHYQEQRPFNHRPVTTEQENAGVGSCG